MWIQTWALTYMTPLNPILTYFAKISSFLAIFMKICAILSQLEALLLRSKWKYSYLK